ncbi:separin protein [Kickxella alabastrina]|nr:separin protein [Kickxella alabastrina]
MAGTFFRGTNIEQDQRFGNANLKLMQQTSFSSVLKKRVDSTKVNMEVIKPWISNKIFELLGLEDEVLFEYIVNMLQESTTPDPKVMQVNLTGFLESKTQDFMQSLWEVLVEAQKSPGGIPESFIKTKVEELRIKREEQDMIKANIRAADERLQGSVVDNARRTRSGRRSRWDAPAASSNDLERPSDIRGGFERHDGDGRQNRDRNMSANHFSDPLLECFRSFESCTADTEKRVLGRLASATKAVSARTDIQFALGIVNQANQLFSKKAGEIRKQLEAADKSATPIDCIERMVRVSLVAFKFLYKHRSDAGFNVLALEKTLSNFTTACTNAHLGLMAWDGLVVLRDWLLEHAETHTVALGSRSSSMEAKPTVRAVRNPASRLMPNSNANPTPAAIKALGQSAQSTERLAAGMHRLSIGKPGLEEAMRQAQMAPTTFPQKFCQSDLGFNNLVVLLLCNSLRVLAQDASSKQASDLARELGSRQNSALEWCLRVREMDSEAVQPFLGVCFRAYYTLGGACEESALSVRLLGLLAYAKSKTCDTRELLKYATRAAVRAVDKATVSLSDVDSFYSEFLGQTKTLVELANLSPELVEFCHHVLLVRRKTSDMKSSLAACRLLLSLQRSGDLAPSTAGELIFRLLELDSHVHYVLENGAVHDQIVSMATKIPPLVAAALDSSVRHTLAGWNAMALCGDTMRKTAKRVLAHLSKPAAKNLQDILSVSLLSLLDAADRVYQAYVSRGAAAKAEGTGGPSISTLLNCNAEVCLMVIQLAVQYQEHSAQAQSGVPRHSDRLLALCRESQCSRGFLRNHSAVFFNLGAGLYQLKSYLRAAQAMKLAIQSLSLWITQSLSKTQEVDGDVLGQLCKRYEIMASAYQEDHSFELASHTYAQAVSWMAAQFKDQIHSTIVATDVTLPPNSSLRDKVGVVDRILMFVDRYARMCARRLLSDPDEPMAHTSLQQFSDMDNVSGAIRAWLYEAEAYFWRPFVAPSTFQSTGGAAVVRVRHLERAMAVYKSQRCSLGFARCILEQAKIDRDQGKLELSIERLHTALEVAKSLSGDCIYVLNVVAECYAWLAVISIEANGHDSDNVSACTSVWSLVCSRASDDRTAAVSLDTGFLRGAVDVITLVIDLLMSRRMHSLCQGLQLVMLNMALLCECQDRLWAPTVMESLVGLGMTCVLQGQTATAGNYFGEAASRYDAGVLPVHVAIASKIAYASFQLAIGDSAAGATAMDEASYIARSSLDLGTVNVTAGRKKRQAADPDTLILLSRASRAFSELALKQGMLADSVDFAVHSYRILNALLKSMSIAHNRAQREQARKKITKEAILSSVMDDPFAAEPAPESLTEDAAVSNESAPETAQVAEESNEDKSDAQFLAFSGNWELQRLLVDNLAHLAKVFSIRGSVKDAEHLLKKGLEISAQLQAPLQENYVRVREVDILSRKSLWDECAWKLRSLRTESDSASAATGRMEAIRALVIEGDSWRRSQQYDRARSAYNRAEEVLGIIGDGAAAEALLVSHVLEGSTQMTPRLRRILGQVSALPQLQQQLAETLGSNISLPLSIIREDISTRQRLLLSLAGQPKGVDSVLPDLTSSPENVERSADQRPEHLLMQANLAFVEFQRLLGDEDMWGQVLQSALVFPALNKVRAQKPRKSTTKALIRDKLGELEELLMEAAESAITVGSAHCVHSSAHLLVLVMGMTSAFGLASVSGANSRAVSSIIASIIDDSRNITVAREVVDNLRRRAEALPAELTTWPADIRKMRDLTESDSNNDFVSRSGLDSRRRMFGSSPVPLLQFGAITSPLLLPKTLRATDPTQLPSLSRLSLSGGELDRGILLNDTAADEAAKLLQESCFERAVDGARVVAEWTANISNSETKHLLSSLLPPSWVVCGVSIDQSRDIMIVTRYQFDREPIVVCLPMREIELDLAGPAFKEPHTPDIATQHSGAFGSMYRKLSAIISESDKTMKTGRDCITDDEKRQWWEHRSLLDRQLGQLLRNIEDEWLGGFRGVLQPVDMMFGQIVSASLITNLRKEIQACVGQCMSKAYAAKAKAIELADELCALVLDAAQMAVAADPSDGQRNDWLDICSMLWDVYSYQGAAPPGDEASVGSFADQLMQTMRSFVATNALSSCRVQAKSQRPHLILALDKHAQQVPWECLPCLRDYPISRVPSVAFLQDHISAMNTLRRGASPLMTSAFSSGLATSNKDLQALSNDARGLLHRLSQPTEIGGRPPGVFVDGNRAFYVLNPEGDLLRTQSNFESFLQAQPGWQGIVGRRPLGHECEQGLSSGDIFLYFGHGGAENYISRNQIRKLGRCAVALLFGCSSGLLKLAGEYDAMGTATDYMIGGCPALVGNLWDVGDKDIDRFAASMLQSWGLDQYSPGTIAVKFEDRPANLNERLASPVSLAEAVCEARRVCRMAFLTGAAPVVYGIPAYLC